MTMRTLSAAALVLSLFSLACDGTAEAPVADRSSARSDEVAPAAGPAELGAAMPAYSAQRLEGGSYELAAERGKVILLNIWATWCGPCRYEIPELVKLQNTYGKEGFEVVGVSVDGPETADEIAPFVQAAGINYPIVLDPDGAIADMFETNVLPTSALIDRDGKVVWTHMGVVESDDDELLSVLKEAL